MTDEVEKTREALDATKAEILKLGADEKAGVTWVKAHVTLIIALACFIAGAVVGHLI